MNLLRKSAEFVPETSLKVYDVQNQVALHVCCWGEPTLFPPQKKVRKRISWKNYGRVKSARRRRGNMLQGVEENLESKLTESY